MISLIYVNFYCANQTIHYKKKTNYLHFQVMLHKSQQKLPQPYKANPNFHDVILSSLSDDVMEDHLRLFLSDPTFPAFVEKVEQQMGKLIEESS